MEDLNLGLYTHANIAGVVDKRKPWKALFLQAFGMEFFSTTTKIIFDEIQDDLRLAPYVRPNLPAKAQTTRGTVASSFEPAYMKPMDALMPKETTVRRVGEPLMGSLSPKQRFEMQIMERALGQRNKILRTMEVAARDFARNGMYVVQGEQYAAQEIDFERNAANRILLTGAQRWSESTAKPVDDMQAAIFQSEEKIVAIFMGEKAMANLQRDSKFKEMMDTRYRGNSTAVTTDLVQTTDDQIIEWGHFGAGKIPVLSSKATYEDETRTASGMSVTKKRYIEDDEVYFIPAASGGYRCYSIIQDPKAGYTAMPHFFKVWADENPSIPQMMTQSAPLLVHTKPNGFVYMKTSAAS